MERLSDRKRNQAAPARSGYTRPWPAALPLLGLVSLLSLAALLTLLAPDPAASAGPPAQATPTLAPLCRRSQNGDSLVAASPLLSPVSFATAHDPGGWPLDPALQFTTAITHLQASFSFAGMRNGLAWERVWYFGNRELFRGAGAWDAGPAGAMTIATTAQEGRFTPGRYRLELYVEGRLLSEGAFRIVAADAPSSRPIRVAYTTWDGRSHQLHVLDLASGQSQPLPGYGREPAWSPDTPGLLFAGEADQAGLWVLNLDTNQPFRLSQEPFFTTVAWSPQRHFVASARPDSAGPRLVLWDLGQNKGYDGPPGSEPAWSPEGRRLAYRGCDPAGWGIQTIPVISATFDASNIQRLTTGDDSQPAWSWDGQRIAFVRREGNNQDIYVVAPACAGKPAGEPEACDRSLVRLTNSPAADTSPAWTPDNRLVFRSLRSGKWGIYIMAADGSSPRRLLDTPAPAAWQPDRLAVSNNVNLVEPTSTLTTGSRVEIPAGYGLLIVSNRKNSDDMTFTINNREYLVAPFQLDMLPLPPGHYTWTASWPALPSVAGLNGTADITAGQPAYPLVEH